MMRKALPCQSVGVAWAVWPQPFSWLLVAAAAGEPADNTDTGERNGDEDEDVLGVSDSLLNGHSTALCTVSSSVSTSTHYLTVLTSHNAAIKLGCDRKIELVITSIALATCDLD